ncbi:hypothetical protein D3C87_1559050 [compost metagenome]
MQLEPLQSDDRSRVVDSPLFYPLVSLFPTHHMNTNIFVFICQTVNTLRGRGVHFTHQNRRALGCPPRTCQVAQHRFGSAHSQPCFFLRLAAGDIFRRFALFDHSGDNLQQPRAFAGIQGGNSNLLNQYHFVTHWVKG